MGTANLQLRRLPTGLIFRSLDKARLRIASFRKDESGVAAIETALISPMFIFALIYAATVAIKVTNYQKLSTASYAGVTYLQDEMLFGDFDTLKSEYFDDGTETGSQKESAVITKMKTVIRTASSLPLRTEDITVDLLCGCPISGSPGDESGDGAVSDYPAEWDQSGSYKTEPFNVQSSENANVCPSKCNDGTDKRILAEVNLRYETKNLMGKAEILQTELVSRVK